MATSTVPFKTPLGQEELRTRGQGLGQRHRTLLVLVDGRRTLAEVLVLAHRAGAQTQHFEDLLRMGLVDLPPEPPPEAPAALPVLTDEAALTSVELVVPQDLSDPAAGEVASPALPMPAPVVEVRRVAVPDLPVLREHPEEPFERTIRQPGRFVPDPASLPVLKVTAEEDPFERTQRLPGAGSADPVQRQTHQTPPVPAGEAASVPAPTPAKRKQPRPDDPARKTVLITSERLVPKSSKGRSSRSSGKKSSRHVPVLMESVVVPTPGEAAAQGPTLIEPVLHNPAPRRRAAKPAPAGAERARPERSAGRPAVADGDEASLLQRVRDHLTDALRLDAPLFSARTFMRVRNAQSRSELIDLVWEIQDHLSLRRRPRKELASLHEARELLGLGNTLVTGDDLPPDHHDDP